MDTQAFADQHAAELLGLEVPIAEEEVEKVEDVEEETTATTETEVEVMEEPQEEKVPLKALQEERRKRQELEQRLKEKEQQKPEQQGNETVDQMYQRDPQGTISAINQEITRLVNDDPYTHAEAIERLRDMKVDLRERNMQAQQVQAGRFVQELNMAVPNFQQKAPLLVEFAINELGYSNETLAQFSNPQAVGPKAAIEFTAMINKAYESKKAIETVRQKQSQPKPTPTERPGDGAGSQQNVNIKQIKERAQSTGNYADYLEAIGAIPKL